MIRTVKSKTLIVSAVVAFLGQAAISMAGPTETSSKEVVPPAAPPPLSYFRANELDIGVFATYDKGVGDLSSVGIGEHGWGGGLDVAYFPWLYGGFRFQGSALNVSRADQTAGIVTYDAVLRYPLDLVAPNFHLAPYGFAGVGGLLGGLDGYDQNGNLRTDSKFLGHFGGGLEYRFTPHIGIFTEAAYDLIDGPHNNAVQINWGTRFAF
jgi:Outer membrane protein beta-barrel domain